MRILGICLTLAACTQGANDPVVSSQRDPIVGGTQAADGQFPSVVAVYESTVGALCTGTLIAPYAVLTAAHCIDPGETHRTVAQILAETVVIFDKVNLNSGGATGAPLSQIFENPNHPNFTAQPPDLGHDDDAILILKTPKTDRLTSAVDLDAHSQVGVMTTQVGYGIHTVGTQSAGVEYYLNGKSTVSCLPDFPDSDLICFDQTDNKGQCNGDSGGPAFDANNHVIGVVSFGDQNCTMFGADTRPSQTAAFILSHVPELAAGTCGTDGVCNLSCASDPDCSATAPPVCGNSKVEAAEECDHGSKNGTAGDTCSSSCKTISGEVCGDGTIEGTEECDDGTKNGTVGDTCSATCKMTDGNGDTGGGGGCSSSGAPLGFGGIVGLGLLIGVARRRRRS